MKKCGLLNVCAIIINVVFITGIGFALDANIDWKINIITATGSGIAPASITNPAQAEALAKRAARVDAQRNLAEEIEGIKIDAKTTVRNLVAVNDSIDASVEAVIKGAKVVAEAFEKGTAKVTMNININGAGSLGESLDKTLEESQQLSESITEDENVDASYDPATNIIEAKGFGFPPKDIENKAQSAALAKRAAKIDAYRNLAEVIDGVQIDANTTVENLITKNDEIKTNVSSLISGAKVLTEEVSADGKATATLSLPITGSNSLSNSIGKEISSGFDLQGLLNLDMNLVDKTDNGIIDWSDGIITAKGLGVAPKEESIKKEALARRAAIVDAQRNLAETVQSVKIDSQTNVKNLELSSDVINSKVSAYINGFKIIREKSNKDGSYEVQIAVKMFGKGNLTDVVLPEENGTYKPEAVYGEGYTGLIVDATGLKVERAMSPKIYDIANNEVYGSFKTIDPDYVVEYGILVYAGSMVDALGTGRAGDNPLIVKGIKAKDDQFDCDVIISQEDAARIKSENEKSKMLDNMRVVLII